MVEQLMKARSLLRNLFGLSQAQANGLMVLIPLIIAAILSEPIWRMITRTDGPDPADVRALDSLVAVFRTQLDTSHREVTSANGVVATRHAEAFLFNPNQVSSEELARLGFTPAVIRRLENYRAKGGIFRVKSDVLKIYGMDSARYRSLEKFINIPVNHSVTSTKGRDRREQAPPSPGWTRKARETVPFDINQADSLTFEEVRGIGIKLSQRIIKYRSALGGFVSVAQLAEVWGLDSLALRELVKVAFIAPDFLPVTININTADERALAAHPYLDRREARAIVAYRFQHGSFAAVSDLGKMPLFSEEKMQQLLPYLKTAE